MGGALPKQFLSLGERPLLMHTLEGFYRWDAGAERILVLPAGQGPRWQACCEEFPAMPPHRVIEGGATRFHSVQNALALVEEEGWVGVHDGVRPLVSLRVIRDCFAAAERYGAAVPVTPVVDSLGRISPPGTLQSVDRRDFFAVQTPQVFRSEWIREAYRQAYTPAFTDDASVVEASGRRIHTVPGNRENLKITGPLDLLIAEALLKHPLPCPDD
jgi:2-C-methyl-D-erythritol 4-phosphate cytidylyltransferase